MEIASRWLVLVLTVVVGSQAFGRVVTVSDKQDLLDAVSASVDDEGRLREDLEVVFAADCKAMTVDPEEFPSVSEQGLLDGNGHVFRLDADACPYGTVTIGREPGGEAAKVRPFAFRGCGQGSGFKNLIFIGLGCVDFVCPMDTMVKDCDFVRCGAVSVSLCEQTRGPVRLNISARVVTCSFPNGWEDVRWFRWAGICCRVAISNTVSLRFLKRYSVRPCSHVQRSPRCSPQERSPA